MLQRLIFLHVAGAVASVSLLTLGTGHTAVQDQQLTGLTEPRVFVREDFHHLSGIAPPLTRSDVTKTVDVIAGTGVNTLIFSLGSRGGMCLYDTHVGQMHSTNVDKWTHAVNYRDALHVRQLVAEGWDRPQLFCDRCHEEGILFFASAPLNIGSHTTEESRGLGRTSDFVFDNPQLRVGKDPDPRAKHVSPTRMNFIYPEVRKERLQVYGELLARYETDGVEVQSEVLPLCKYDQVDRCAPLLTEWFRELRKIANQAEKTQGRRKRIYVRIPANPNVWSAVGFEVSVWVTERLVDGLICTSNDPEILDQDLDLSAVVSLTRDNSCRVLVGCGTTLQRKLKPKATAKMIWGAAANAYHQGAVGFGLNDMIRSQGLLFLDDMHSTLRLLGSPTSLASANKIYRVRDLPRTVNSFGTGLPETPPPLPRPLKVGHVQRIPLRVADDLHRWRNLDRVKHVKLRVRLSNLEPTRNKLRILLNDTPLPEANLQITDLTYRFIQQGVAYQGNQIYEYVLSPEMYPIRGINTVSVTLLQRDPSVDLEFQVRDVDCSIEYRHHRHFESRPIDY